MTTDKDDDLQVRAALTTPVTAAFARAVMYRTRERLAELAERKSEALTSALDPRAEPETVREARASAEDLAFEHQRLTVAAEQLKARADELSKAEQVAAKQAGYDAAKAERDALAREIGERYPVIVGELVALLQRLKRSDDLCAQANSLGVGPYLLSADEVARGTFVAGGVRKEHWPKLSQIKLPPIESGDSWAWPERSVLQ